MPLGASRLNFLSKTQTVVAAREAIETTVIGNTKISTAQSKFGGSSVLFDGDGDRLDFSTGSISGSFTLEFFVRWNTTSTNNQYVFSNRGGFDPGAVTLENINNTSLRLTWKDGNSTTRSVTMTSVISTGVWYHYAVMVAGTVPNDNVYFFIDGVSKLGGGANPWENASLNANRSGVCAFGGATFGNNFDGYIDEFRLSNSGRYSTTGFSAPTSAFTNDENTIALFHMDGTNNSTTFTDDNS